ncbi:MAG: hypothetical protein LBD64_06300 [Odoribacteraceae bacterium]|jgi:hypothetical protein|nr:hypothetical protein [Odoribacteraceae bacterium]
METNQLQEIYKARVSELDDEALLKNYMEQEGYTREYIALLEEELRARKISLLDAFLSNQCIPKKRESDQKTRGIHYMTIADLLEIDARREREQYEARVRAGQRGKHVTAGYIFSVLVGIIGLFIALDYLYTKRVLNNETVYKYDSATRYHARWMLLLIATMTFTSFMIQL